MLVLIIVLNKELVGNSDRPNDTLLFKNILLFQISSITVLRFQKKICIIILRIKEYILK